MKDQIEFREIGYRINVLFLIQNYCRKAPLPTSCLMELSWFLNSSKCFPYHFTFKGIHGNATELDQLNEVRYYLKYNQKLFGVKLILVIELPLYCKKLQAKVSFRLRSHDTGTY